MSLFYEVTATLAAGVVLCWVAFAATAVPVATIASIHNFTFRPDTITIPVGTTVVWQNDDHIVHTVVALDGAFRSPALDPDDKFSFTFDQAEPFEYFCSLHPHMRAKVVGR